MGTVRRTAALTAATTLTLPFLLAGTGRAAPSDTIGGPQLAGRGEIANLAPGVPALPKNDASAWIIADAGTGDVLAAKDPHGQYLPASALKTLTSITLIPKLNREQEITPTQATCDVTGTKVGMDPKMSYKVEDLFRALLMVSGNDAALALTQAAGGYQQTVAEMNAEAKRLQADDTLAGSPNGLDVDLGLDIKSQHTSVYDLALFMKQGLTLPDFREYIATKDAHWPAPLTADDKKKGHKEGGYPIYSHDRLLPGEGYAYPGILGGKNGYTEHSEQTFVGAAQRDGHTIIIALMHSPSLWNVATGLLNWGFAADGKVQPIGKLVDPVDSKKKQQATGSTASKSSSSSGGGLLLPVGGGAVLAVVLAGGGFLLWRRRGSKPAAAGAAPSGVMTPSAVPSGAPDSFGAQQDFPQSNGDPYRQAAETQVDTPNPYAMPPQGDAPHNPFAPPPPGGHAD